MRPAPARVTWVQLVERTAPAGIVLAAGMAFVAAVLWLTGGSLVLEREPQGVAAPAPTVAWEDLESPGQAVGGLTKDVETFDSLPIDSGPPSDWTSSGGGAAAVVPLPTSVDRSLRLTSSPSGDASFVCRAVATPEERVIQVSLDVLLGPAVPDGATVINVAEGDTTIAAVSTREGTMEVTSENGAIQVAQNTPTPGLQGTTDWLHLDLTVTGAADSLCILSPEGPAGWIAVDNVAVIS
ncbi:MAG TPA: hypothetical protein VFP56_09985 [Candidatus Limnocylindrales bacterium]|nr:hypothetical protein [Candidatus Limnocylindrales bacterium]